MKTPNNPKHLLIYSILLVALTVMLIVGLSFLVRSIPQGYFGVRKGNKLYEKEQYTDAEVQYRRIIDKDAQNFYAHYNLGNSLFKQEKAEDSENAYLQARKYADTDNKLQQAHLLHNIGNTEYAKSNYAEAARYYRESLLLNPHDDETRYNFVKAMQMLQVAEGQQNEQQQDQQEKEGEQQQQQQQQQQNDSTQNAEQQEMQQAEESDKDDMDKQTAEQILQALEQDEQQTLENMQRQQGGKTKRVEKDW